MVSNYVGPFPQTERNAGLKLHRSFSPDREECWSQTTQALFPRQRGMLVSNQATLTSSPVAYHGKIRLAQMGERQLHVLGKLSKTKRMCVDIFKVHKSDLSILHTIIMPTFGVQWVAVKRQHESPVRSGNKASQNVTNSQFSREDSDSN